MHHQRRTKHLGQSLRLGVVEVRANLRQVRAVVGRRVEIDADLTVVDNLGHEQIREPRCERSLRASGKGPIDNRGRGNTAEQIDRVIELVHQSVFKLRELYASTRGLSDATKDTDNTDNTDNTDIANSTKTEELSVGV